MLQSLGYSERDWTRVNPGHVQSQGITVRLTGQWEEEDGLWDFIVTEEGGTHTARTVGTNMLSGGLYYGRSLYVQDNLWSVAKETGATKRL